MGGALSPTPELGSSRRREQQTARPVNGSELTRVGWMPSTNLGLAEWSAVGRRFGEIGRCSQWWLGDWIHYGNAKFGERYSRAVKLTGYDVQSLMNMVYVASRFEISRRRENLSWSHHATLASLELDRAGALALARRATSCRWPICASSCAAHGARARGRRSAWPAVITEPPDEPCADASSARIAGRRFHCHIDGADGTDLLVLGAGAKGTAIAMKAHVLNRLGLGPVGSPSWRPSGRRPRGATATESPPAARYSGSAPPKTCGFPYQGSACVRRRRRARGPRPRSRFSWQRYLVEKRRYAAGSTRARPPVQRRVFGDYLRVGAGARERTASSVVRGRVARVALDPEQDRWLVDVADAREARRARVRRVRAHRPGRAAHDRPRRGGGAARARLRERAHGDRTRARREQSSDIAIVGGGESALSCMEFVRAKPPGRPPHHLHREPADEQGGELLGEPRLLQARRGRLALPAASSSRREFIARSDRGVFGPDRVAAVRLRRALPLRRRPRRARRRGPAGARCASPTRAAPRGAMRGEHDYVINCTGYDPLEQLRLLLAPDARAELERQVGPLWEARSPAASSPSAAPRAGGACTRCVHLPGLAVLSQGPGFSTLGALGLLADRVLEPLVRAETQRSRREPLAARRVTIASACRRARTRPSFASRLAPGRRRGAARPRCSTVWITRLISAARSSPPGSGARRRRTESTCSGAPACRGSARA